MAIELPEKFEWMIANATDEWYATREMTPETLRTFMEQRVINDDEKAPKVGADAPDINVEVLSHTGQRTGDMVTLSSYMGKPVGLIFGSYT